MDEQEGGEDNPEGVPMTRTQLQCVACREYGPREDRIGSRCSHCYCRDCLLRHLEHSLSQDFFFPPECCGDPIPLTSMLIFLSPDLIERYLERMVEKNDRDRTYCADPHCARYLSPAQGLDDSVRSCKKCPTRTCTQCKARSHPGACVMHDSEVLQMAINEGWQRCLECHNLVELVFGCNHIMYEHGLSIDSYEQTF